MSNDKITRWIKIVVMRLLKEKNLFHLDVSTLLSAGNFGYSQALQRFDPSKNTKLKTFAEYRIRGAVLDEVRKMIGDERCKNKRPHQVQVDFETVKTDHGDQDNETQTMLFIEGLPLDQREMNILKLKVMGYNLREIARIIGVSNSRASQLMAKIKKTVYENHGGELRFKLVNRECPTCGTINAVADVADEFKCDECDQYIRIVNGSPIAAVEPEIEGEEE